MRPADLVYIKTPEAVSISPDGRMATYALRAIDLDEDSYTSQLWRVPTDGSSSPVQITRGRRDRAPRYSSDGRWVAFIRTAGEAGSQLYVLPADGGEPWPVTSAAEQPLGVDAPLAWSPDSTLLAYTAAVPDASRGEVPGIAGKAAAPRRITTLHYQQEGQGYLADRHVHVFVVDPFAPKPCPVQLTQGNFDNTCVAWRPDGQQLAFVSARHTDRNRTMTSDIFVMAPDGTGLRQVTNTRTSCDRPMFSADGDTLFYAGMELGDSGFDWFARHTGVYVVPADGTGEPKRISDPERYTLEGHFGRGARGILFVNQNRGSAELLEFEAESRQPRVVIGGRRQVGAADADGGVVAAVVSDPGNPGDLICVSDCRERLLTSYGVALTKQVELASTEEITARTPDGYLVHGWLVRPVSVGPHPVLLLIHGGPFAQYGWNFFDEAQVYAGAGYAVVMGNPRGSSGYGYAHAKCVAGDVGARSAPDLLALLDEALQDASLDKRRIGVLGGSHGGYMVNWLMIHTARFLAGVSERSINAIDSFIATSDVGWAFTSLYGADIAQQRRQSPIAYAEKIKAPLLIIHSEEDRRAPLEQAQRFYHSLKQRGSTVEMLIFPGEGHGLSRNGRPSHRIARFDAILEWFDRNLHAPDGQTDSAQYDSRGS